MEGYDEERLFEPSRKYLLMKQNTKPNPDGIYEFVLDLRTFKGWQEHDQFRCAENWGFEPISSKLKYDSTHQKIAVSLKGKLAKKSLFLFHNRRLFKTLK